MTLEVNPPTVEIMDEQSRERASSGVSNWDYVATQVGLLSSRSIAERAAQDLNLANNKDFVGEGGDAAATARAGRPPRLRRASMSKRPKKGS